MKIVVKFIYTCLLVFAITICSVSLVHAQSEETYNEDDYDGEYEYINDDPYSSHYGNVQQSKKPKYGNARNEDELYNGNYQRYLKDEQGTEILFNKLQIFGGKYKGATNDNIEGGNNLFQPEKPKTIYRPSQIPGTPEGTKPDEGLSDQYGVGIDSKEVDPEEGNNPGTPPPPPDEPDVPVDTAIPFLVVSGVMLAVAAIGRKQTIQTNPK